ncbi:unnamed protein product [Clonostachys rosea f. rosea IK726]|uniref:Uncharacterized protein n=1 Tax=Clonostachys rosea f. rosea IK726 TaxID=1349383 RepID=A0ACA9TQ69_BIOOC|nr:unnamed protein product [Clonostachys rosea f. rosea IK726]
MPYTSRYPALDIPSSNILSYLFPDPPKTSREPLWFDSKDPSKNLSPAQLLNWVRRLGCGLQRLGLNRGDVVMICSPNQIFVPVAYLGIVGAGCVFSGANPAYTEHELVHQITNTTAKVILAHPKMLSLILPAAAKAGVPKERIFQFSEVANPTLEGVLDWRIMAGTERDGNTWTWPELGSDEAKKTIATINYSSGTTGLPKGVCVSHGNLIANGWGMTEVTCGALHVPGGVRDDSGSVGQLDPNCECRLVDDDGNEVKTGSPGEIHIRGPNICLGYWRNEAATKETLDEDGWLKTGDIAICDEKGFFWIELIKVNALQVAPAELEAALLENENVADAAVVGITLNGSEWPRAYVVIQEASQGKVTPSDIQKWLAPRVAKHKQLAGGVVFIDEVPKLASGKIQRKTMREWAKRDAAELEKEAHNAGNARAKL